MFKEDLEYQLNKIKESNKDVILLGYGGSHAYGTNIETSDIDIRGIYKNNPEELIGIYPDSEQYVDSECDTVLYSLKKMTKLLYDGNPNTIEILGLRKQDYLLMTDEGKLLVDNANLFLSKRIINTFGGYAKSQLNRLVNRSGRKKNEINLNESRSLEKVFIQLKSRYSEIEKETFKAEPIDETVLLSMNLKDMPIENVSGILNEINNVHASYKKSVRNDKAASHDKLNKHSMHLIRLWMMGIDILKHHEIRTYRDGPDHDLLMSIRNGDYLEKDMVTPTKAFEELISEYEAKFLEAAETTTLPDNPDYNGINKMIMSINRKVFV